MNIALRDAAPQDEVFLFSLFRAIHEAQFKGLGWPEDRVHALVAMQFEARRASYSNDFPGAVSSIVLMDDTVVGALIISRSPVEMRIVDISILPAYQGRGIGKTLVQRLIEESRETAVPLNLTVQKNNAKALRLYRKSGFREVKQADGNGLFLHFEFKGNASE